MKRTINYKALIIIGAIPTSILLLWLVGVGIWNTAGNYNPTLWTEVHNQPLLNNIINGVLLIFCLAIAIIVIGIIGYGIYKLFNWIFPKVKSDENKRGN